MIEKDERADRPDLAMGQHTTNGNTPEVGLLAKDQLNHMSPPFRWWEKRRANRRFSTLLVRVWDQNLTIL
jgi:hypothetical protein